MDTISNFLCVEKMGWSDAYFVTRNERHTLKDAQVLARRERVLLKAKQANPVRWNGRNVRNCSPVPPTALNPVRPSKRVEASEILVA